MKQRKETPKSSDLPIYLFKQGNNQEAYRYFGAHLCEENGEAGAVFRVWAPHAKAVSIVGDFNSWTPGEHPMEKVTDGIWERFVPGIRSRRINTFHLSPMRVSVVSTGQAGSSFFAFASIISIPPKIFSSAKLPKNLTTAQSFLSGNYPLVSIW